MLINYLKNKIKPVLGYFFKLTICCILLVTVIVVSTTILYKSNYDYLKAEQYEYYRSNLSSICIDIENMLYKTVQSTYVLEENPHVYELLMNTSADRISIPDINSVTAYFKRHKAIYGDIIDEILILDKARNKVINDVSCYDADFYFEKLSGCQGYNSDILTKAPGIRSLMYEILSPVFPENKMDQSSRAVIPIVFYRGSSHILNNPLIINISVDYLEKYLSQHKLSSGSRVVIYDKNGDAYTTRKHDRDLVWNYIHNIPDRDSIYISYENGRAMFSGIRYLASIPRADISSELAGITRMYALCMSICGLIALLISYYILKTFYNPVTKLMGVFSLGFKDMKNKNYKNEFEMIEKNIRNIIYNNSSLNAELSSVLPIAGERLLIKLLTKQSLGGRSEAELASQLEKSGVSLKHEYYMTAIVDFNYHELFYKKFTEDIRKMIYDSMMPLMLSFFHSPVNIYAMELKENKVCLVINIPDVTYSESVMTSLRGFGEAFSHDSAYVTVLVGVGTAYRGLMGLGSSYDEAQSVASGLSIYNSRRVVLFDGAAGSGIADITDMEENKLRNYLEKGMEAEAMELFDEIVRRCMTIYSSNANRAAVLWKIYNIAVSVLEATETEPHTVITCKMPKDPMDISLEELSSLAGEACSRTAAHFATRKKGTMADVMDYINKNYNKDIYLESVANEFGLSSKYLSRAFKKHTNTRFVDYLNSIRIQKAKELLTSENKSIIDVALEVGFNSQSTFYRVFKNSEGITPAEYRNRIGK